MDKFTLTREEAVLLVIDIQERLVPAMPSSNQVILKTNTLITIAKKLDIPIIVTEQYPQGLGRTIREISANLTEAPVFEKKTFSGCTEEVVSALNQLNRKKIIVTGIETHICVFQTVRDLLSADYQVFVVGDAVCSRTKENYQNALSLVNQMGGVVTNTETVFFDLIKEAATPQFRELSKLIK
ncbi:MAG: isochorismatase family protein [Desulfitobacteriaceae bacterium]|nr:isochorismatase family protein [Desulfitobacteriaceae bacterium]